MTTLHPSYLPAVRHPHRWIMALLGCSLLTACLGSGNTEYNYGGPLSPLDYSAIGQFQAAPAAEPVPITAFAPAEPDPLNPANGVTAASYDTADQVPVSLANLPAVAADPDKPNS